MNRKKIVFSIALETQQTTPFPRLDFCFFMNLCERGLVHCTTMIRSRQVTLHRDFRITQISRGVVLIASIWSVWRSFITHFFYWLINSNRSWGGQGFCIPCLEFAPPPSHGKLFSTVKPYKWTCKKRKITSTIQRHTPWANLNYANYNELTWSIAYGRSFK